MARWKGLRLAMEAGLGAALADQAEELKGHAAFVREALEHAQAADGAVRAYVRDVEGAMEEEVKAHEEARARRRRVVVGLRGFVLGGLWD